MSTVPKPAKPPKTPRYWKGHDTVEADLANIRELLDLSHEGEYRDGWWRFCATTKIEEPLERIILARERSEHFPFKTRWTSRHSRGQRLCACGLIVPGRDIPNQLHDAGSSSFVFSARWPDDPAQRVRVEAALLATPGHLSLR